MHVNQKKSKAAASDAHVLTDVGYFKLGKLAACIMIPHDGCYLLLLNLVYPLFIFGAMSATPPR